MLGGSSGSGSDFFLGGRGNAGHDRLLRIVEELDTRELLHLGNVDRVAHLESRDVDLDELRQILRQAADAQGVRGKIENAALVLHAIALTGDSHADVDLHLLVGGDLVKVDVHVLVGQRVLLHFADERNGILAVRALELDQRGRTANGLQEAAELRLVDGKLHRLGVLSVENGGDFPARTQTARGTATLALAGDDVELKLLHGKCGLEVVCIPREGGSPKLKRGAP